MAGVALVIVFAQAGYATDKPGDDPETLKQDSSLAEVIKLSAVSVSPDLKAIEFEIRLPIGTKFNRKAPFRLEVESDNPKAIKIGEYYAFAPSRKISVPVKIKKGRATMTATIEVGYCYEHNEDICFPGHQQLVIPIVVSKKGGETLSAVFEIGER